MSNVREEAIYVIDKVLRKGAYSNLALDSSIKKAGLNSLDNGLLTEIVYGTIKYKYTIDKILNEYVRDISKTNTYILNLLRICLYQLKYLDKIPDFAVVNEGVNLAKKMSVKQSKFVNGILRSYLRKDKDIKFSNKIEELSFLYSFPKAMTKTFIVQYGEENAKLIMEGLNKTPGVNVRVNRTKISYEEAYNSLEENGYKIKKGKACKNSINIIKGKSIEANPLFKSGEITVQDESAMMVGDIMDLQNNMTVMDLCSAPGGKTTEMAEILNNTGKVYAFDLYQSKLNLIKKNCNRLGLSNVIIQKGDARELQNSFINKADRVLLDVPCSGIGIIRKKPEIKWKKNLGQLGDLVKIQRDILLNGSRYLKVNGILVYSTCTLNKKENEDNINWFLENNTNYEKVQIDLLHLDNFKYSNKGYLTILPDEYMDGFFMAKLKRIK